MLITCKKYLCLYLFIWFYFVNIEVKQIIDSHFIEYTRYYTKCCCSQFRTAEIQQDALHELYLKFIDQKPEIIKAYNDKGKLKVLGVFLLKRLMRDSKRPGLRQNVKYNQNLTNISHAPDMLDICTVVKKLIDENQPEPIPEEKIDRIKHEVFTGLSQGDFSTQAFVMSLLEPTTETSRRSKIPYKTVLKGVHEMKIKLSKL